jgi:hypothetical protein
MNLKEWIYSCIECIYHTVRPKVRPNVPLDDYGYFVDFTRKGKPFKLRIDYNFFIKKRILIQVLCPCWYK